ncbi:F-box/LRR-repeat protein At3g48880-like [Abrus precatorius]|uniref:F-box/LRR-repeat protein At3g48880-like n=1 Tax=Abrus precatorius TaxID=3816 RepID=A0A8B8K3J9_ABRPR|nr:F-box/LRR-repeat protein At3g48880-like [Abrus precatorius]
MKKRNSGATSPINHLCDEILVGIFMLLNVADIAAVSLVCKSWNRVCREPSLWRKLDLTSLGSPYFYIPNTREALRDKRSSTRVTQFLKYVLSLSNGNTSCIVFNYYIYLTDVHLISAAERTQNLKRLILPITGSLTRRGINAAMRCWRGLESITLTSMVKHNFLFPAIGKYCRNITEVKFTCGFLENHADALVKYTPNLRILSIRYVIVSMKGLCTVLNSLQRLEMVNICHSVIMDKPHPRSEVSVYGIGDLRSHLDISCMRKLIFCQGRRCLRCRNGHEDNNSPSRQPYGHFEDIWREDEIITLAH